MSDPEYPSNGQMDGAWSAYKKDGKDGILAFLQEQRRKRGDG